MRRSHFETFSPVCPRCRATTGELRPIEIGSIEKERGEHVLEGVLRCSADDCRQEYPILDGLPILLPQVRPWIVENLDFLTQRDDLSPVVESLLGDCAGPGSRFDARRQHLSNYAFDHYGDFDPEPEPSGATPASIVGCLARGLELLDDAGSVDGPALDIGCGVGRGTFEAAARTGDLVLGVDLHAPKMRLAASVLRTGRLRAPLRRTGVVYDVRDYAVDLPGADRVDFWVADALALPLAPGGMGLVTGQNVLDCIASPLGLLAAVRDQLAAGGGAVLSTPYDWSPNATPYEAWLGGHSQRGPGAGSSETLVRELLGDAHPSRIEGLSLVGEDPDVPWSLRLHDRSVMHYRTHVLALRRA